MNKKKEINNQTKNKKIVIIFDELDRCTPTNQIIFLSYIKNIFFKITNIFFIVSSNNEVINQKLYIENKREYESKYELENYTDKLFNSVFDLDIHFDAENLIFTDNEFIKQFLKEMDIKNPRLINKIIENLETIMKIEMNKQNNDFYSLIKENHSKKYLNKIEFV
ncbi:P-loop NTPase fold protein [Spiroplasma sp. AdecLV25b]|uniref:P-loop NTPase fold protein n=1 Tax=Spiroplasma sp. AdecLV25b TaxID=3027162 RepID=UPI0027DEE907|nr:P-loop NTPase fold protein [Spiroplasma sp. AdecLV25b]